MKLFLSLALLFSVPVFASEGLYPDQDLSCLVTSEDKRYDDIFMIEVREKGLSKVRYKRKYLASPAGEYGDLEIVRGCWHATQVANQHHPHMIRVECLEDGQEGIVDINSETLKGGVYFYYPKIGYGERTQLDFECTRMN